METLEDLDRQIAELRERRKQLVKKERRLRLTNHMIELFKIIYEHPGIDRNSIVALMELNTEDTYINTITSLRRRDLIVNVGTRQHPVYFTKEYLDNQDSEISFT